MKQSLLLVCFCGTWKAEGDFHVSFSFTIKYLKSTVSEEDEEEPPPHNFRNSNIQTETDRQTRPAPAPRLEDLLQPLTPWSPCSVHNPGAHGGWRQTGDPTTTLYLYPRLSSH